MGGGGETQIAAGERQAKGLALRGKVRSSGRFWKTHQQRCTSMYTDQCNTTAAIPRKLQEEVKYLVKWGNNQAKEKSEMPVVIVMGWL